VLDQEGDDTCPAAAYSSSHDGRTRHRAAAYSGWTVRRHRWCPMWTLSGA